MVRTVISPIPVAKSKNIKTKKEAFTLLELVIVVIIMGLLYSMVSLNVSKATTTLSTLSAKNIADFLATQQDTKKRTFYLYGDKCQYAEFEPKLPEEVTVDSIVFSAKTTAYWFDNFGTMQQLAFAPRKKDYFLTPVCLKYEQFANGSHTPIVIQSGKKFYYHSFFNGSKSFSSLEEAAEWIRHTRDNPKNLGLRR